MQEDIHLYIDGAKIPVQSLEIDTVTQGQEPTSDNDDDDGVPRITNIVIETATVPKQD